MVITYNFNPQISQITLAPSVGATPVKYLRCPSEFNGVNSEEQASRSTGRAWQAWITLIT
jgi:hypothetical protein